MAAPSIIYFNNCRGRDHAAIFGPGAFFDLATTGPQAKQAMNLPVGHPCVVASYTADRKVEFNWYTLTRENAPIIDPEGIECRVFYGDHSLAETFTKAVAARTPRFRPFFNVNGDFKRPSVIAGDIRRARLPSAVKPRTTYCPEEVVDGGSFIEGATRTITVNAYERSAAARTACIDIHGTACVICGFDFGIQYGHDAEGYIHVHHLKPLSKIGSSYTIDPKKDLRPICPNCHAVIHLGGHNRSINTVKRLIQSRPSALSVLN